MSKCICLVLLFAWCTCALVVFNKFSVLSYADKPLAADEVNKNIETYFLNVNNKF